MGFFIVYKHYFHIYRMKFNCIYTNKKSHGSRSENGDGGKMCEIELELDRIDHEDLPA